MIDNFIFLVTMLMVPWLCFKASQLDDLEKKEKEAKQNAATKQVEKDS